VAESVPAEVRAGRKEHFVAFYLDARSRLLRFETVSIGTLSASLVHPREVFAPAISHSAAGLVVAHNHPSGDCAPSAEDKDATRRLARSGELLGIPLLDHVIVADRGFFSFREHGLLS
jgi:DNA repair protein RadC